MSTHPPVDRINGIVRALLAEQMAPKFRDQLIFMREEWIAVLERLDPTHPQDIKIIRAIDELCSNITCAVVAQQRAGEALKESS